MKKHVLNFVKGLIFAIVLLWAIYEVYEVLKWKDTTGEYLSSVEQLYATEADMMDVVFVGSSHCYSGIQPAVLWGEYGIAAFDMSVSGQDKDSAYHDMVELYKTQHPAVVYIDLYALLFDEHAVESNVYRNYLSLKTSSNSISLVNKYIEKEQRKDFIFRFPIIHTRYRELKKYDFQSYPPNSFGRGEFLEFHVGGSWLDSDTLNNRTVGELSEKNREWLSDLMQLAEENESFLEFIVIPFWVSSAQQEILNAAEEFITARGYAYTDFNKMLNFLDIDSGHDFSDLFHLNIYGAEKLTQYIGRNIVSKYALEDRRGDGRYYQWENDYRWYGNEKIKNQMKGTNDLSVLVELISQFSDGIAVISLEGDFANASDNYLEILEPLGIDYDEYYEGGKWIYQDGYMQKICGNVLDGQDFYLDLNRYEKLKINYYGDFKAANIMFGYDAYQTPSFLSIVVYDRFLGEVVTNL